METLVIALIATGNMYRQQKVSVPEPAKLEAFDLQALTHEPLNLPPRRYLHSVAENATIFSFLVLRRESSKTVPRSKATDF
jgi:hypothetical protein